MQGKWLVPKRQPGKHLKQVSFKTPAAFARALRRRALHEGVSQMVILMTLALLTDEELRKMYHEERETEAKD